MKPDTIKVLGHNYAVVYDPKLLAKSNGNPGEVNYFLNEIVLSDEVPDSSRNETLIHEILEVLNNRLQLEIPHNTITVLSEGLYQTLRDNGLQFN